MRLAIIGGSLFSEISVLEQPRREHIKTPFGEPSEDLSIGTFAGSEVVYLNRHGHQHHIAPHQINYRANMFALKMLDVSHIMAITAVGGISDEMSPMRWVIPHQLIDYTYGRMQTYNDGNDHEVKHIDFTEPFSNELRDMLHLACHQQDIDYTTEATYAVTQGPRLETAAEIRRLERDGCDIVGMTAMPEAALARELDMEYATLSLVVNWAAGKNEGIVSMGEIRQRLMSGEEIASAIVEKMMEQC